MPVEIEQDTDGKFFRFLNRAEFEAKFLTREALRDIANKLQDQARIEAPEGETGLLKAHPVDITESREGRPGTLLGPGEAIETRAPTFGGGFAVRGAGGRFTRGGATRVPGIPGATFERVTVSVARRPEHARWVHDGTGIYGRFRVPIVPKTSQFLHFHWRGHEWFVRSVKGQRANPYLTRAFVIIEKDYIPLRIEILREEIRTIE